MENLCGGKCTASEATRSNSGLAISSVIRALLGYNEFRYQETRVFCQRHGKFMVMNSSGPQSHFLIFANHRNSGCHCCGYYLGILLAIGLVNLTNSAQAMDLKTGRQFENQLNAKVTISWSGQRLRAAIRNLSKSQGVAIMLDRRVNPDQLIQLSVRELSLKEALVTLADQIQMGVCYVGPVAYLGPPQITTKLATLAAIKEMQAVETSRPLTTMQSRRWEALATPRELLQAIAEEAALSISGIQAVPHDLWPAVQLPRLSISQQLTLILAGFDLSFDIDTATSIRIAPIPNQLSLRRSYTLGRNSKRRIERIRKQFPEAIISIANNRITIDSTQEIHQAIRKTLGISSARPGKRNVTTGEKRYTLENRAPVGAVLNTIAQSTGYDLDISADAQERLKDPVSINVNEVTLENLLRASLDPAGLKFKIADGTIKVFPKTR